ncbi:MAG: hypothetical protein AAFX85_12645 [Pseudomonadota bacterium]
MLTGKEVLVKTDKGHVEVKEQADSILPREARTLLILANGRDTVDDYRAALSGSRAFEALGGIDQLITLLLDLEYLAFEQEPDAQAPLAPEAEDDSPPNPPRGSFSEEIVLASTQGDLPVRPPPSDSAEDDIALAFASGDDTARAHRPPRPPAAPSPAPPLMPPPALPPRPARDPAPVDLSVEELRASIADLFERHPDLEDRWTWLFRLEECATAEDLLALLEAFKLITRRLPKEVARLAAILRANR